MLQKSSTASPRQAIESVQAALQPTFIPFSCHIRSVATCFTNVCCPEQVEPFDHVTVKKDKLLTALCFCTGSEIFVFFSADDRDRVFHRAQRFLPGWGGSSWPGLERTAVSDTQTGTPAATVRQKCEQPPSAQKHHRSFIYRHPSTHTSCELAQRTQTLNCIV